MYEISAETSFSAAHHLKNYAGPCENVHGHNWTVRAYVHCEVLNECGIAIDFRFLRNTLGEAVKELDHADLNVIFEKLGENPSSENLARSIFHKLEPLINNETCRIVKVEVSETPGNTAAYCIRPHA